MRRNATRASPQVFVLVGPLGSRIAASLLPPQSAVVNNSTTGMPTTSFVLESTNSTQTLNLSSVLSQQVGVGVGQFNSQQDDALNAIAAPLQDHRHLRPFQAVEAQQQQELATSGALMNSLVSTTTTNYNHEAQSLSATLARLSGLELLLVIALISLILISIVGNCLVCVAIFTDRRLRKLGNAFIVSLAIADLFVSCLVMTFALCNDLMDWWMFGERFCDIWISFDIMCCTASILNLCAISLDRFIHIKDCLLYNQLMTRRVAFGAVLGIWLISALVSFVPINLGWHKPNHFKSPSQPQPAAPLPSLPSSSPSQILTPNSRGATLMNARGALTETHATLLAAAAAASEPPNDNLMHGERLRRQATPFESDSAPTRSENSGIQGAAAAGQQLQHFDHYTQFAQPAVHESQSTVAGRRSANKDFVPTKRLAPIGAGTCQQSVACASSGLNDHADAASDRTSAQVDFGGGLRAPSSAANYYDSNQLASETGKPKQSDDQVESNPPDGPSVGREQIKPQLRKKRIATESASRARPPAVQTGHSSGQRPSRTTALLDNADEQPPMGGSSMSPIGDDHEVHLASAGVSSHREGQQRRLLQPEAESGGSGEGGDSPGGHDHLPQCMLTLTPTYAIISSTISFYIPCLIMLGLYSKLFACARRHVRNIRAITRAPHPIVSTTAGIIYQAATNAPTNGGGGAATHLNSGPPETGAISSSSCRGRSSQSVEPTDTTRGQTSSNWETRSPLVSRARTWIKFAVKSSPGRSHTDGSASERPMQRSCTPAQSVGPLAGRDNSTSAVSSPPANDRRASCSLSPSKAQRLSTKSGTNEKTIDQAAAREDEPFLGCQTAELCDNPTISTNKNYCDNANDSLLTRTPLNASKFVSSATGVKLNLAPSEAQQQQQRQQQQQQQQQAAATILASQQQNKQQQTSQLATHKAAITLGIIMGTFLFCWVPFFCLNIIKAFYVDSIPGSMFRAFTWLGYANSALNPIIYGIHNSEFRNAFNRIFFKHLTLKNGRHYLNRRFSYDLRPHHHQAHQQLQQRQHAHHHHQHPSYHATNHNTGGAASGGSVVASANHQLNAQPGTKPAVSIGKHQASRAEKVWALVDSEQMARIPQRPARPAANPRTFGGATEELHDILPD